MKGKLLIIVLVIILALVGAGTFAIFGNYSKGSRAGIIVKYSTKGVVFKTREGQLNVGGMQQGDDGDLMPTIWDFSVYSNNEQVNNAIEDAVMGGYRVRLHYEEKYFQFEWRGDTKYFVTKVERVKDKLSE